MRKRVLGFLCWVLLLFSLFACSTGTPAGDSGGQANSDQSDEPQSDTLAILEAAGEKLRNAESFEMKMMGTTAYTGSEEPTLLQMQYVADKDGAPASFLQIYSPSSSPSRFRYLYGNSGFEGVLEEGNEYVYDTKHIRDENFNSSQHFWSIQYGFNIQNSNMFEKFCQLEHSVATAEDGAVTILFEDLTGWQVAYFMEVAYPMNLGLDVIGPDHTIITSDTIGTGKLSVNFSVDPQGYLSKIQIDRWYFSPAKAEYILAATRSLTFSCFNEEMELQEPGFEAKFKRDPDGYPTVYHHFGEHHAAWYTYDAENSTYYLRGPNYMYDNDGDQRYYIDAYYKVPSEFDGVPISEIAFNNYCADIKGLIIPKTAIIQLGGDGDPGFGYGTLFFEDTRENIKGNFKNTCYFAGEWEYVDGVPTPIQ